MFYLLSFTNITSVIILTAFQWNATDGQWNIHWSEIWISETSLMKQMKEKLLLKSISEICLTIRVLLINFGDKYTYFS